MFLIRGVYHFWPKRVGFRNDYCRSCEGPRRAIATRSFDVGHVFFVPILPVGFWKRWSCTQCRRNPHAPAKTRRVFKWIGLVCLILLAIMFWTATDDPEFSLIAWALRILPAGGAIALLINLLVTPKDPRLRELLAAIPPASDSACPFCATPLMAGGDGGHWSCPSCGAVRY
jgi:hypothetical protein